MLSEGPFQVLFPKYLSTDIPVCYESHSFAGQMQILEQLVIISSENSATVFSQFLITYFAEKSSSAHVLVSFIGFTCADLNSNGLD